MNLQHTLALRQEQKQIQTLSPRLIQMMRIFQMGYDRLQHEIRSESQSNVFLEPMRFDDLGPVMPTRKGSARTDYAGEDDDPLAQVADRKLSLQAVLLRQLELSQLRDHDQRICEALISGLDERGYFLDFEKTRVEVMASLGVTERKVKDVLKVLQSFEPEGVGARSLQECLEIQVREHDFEDERLVEALFVLIRKYLDDLAAGNLEKIASGLKLSIEGVRHLGTFIRENLDPAPGKKYSTEQEIAAAVSPSFRASIKAGKLILHNLEKSRGPIIQLSETYLKRLEDPKLDQASKAFLQAQFERAYALVENIKKREESLQRLGEILFSKQHDFLEKGRAFLKPFLQKELAQQLGLSGSTVSRILSEKYVETPHGTFPLKVLCPRRIFGRTRAHIQEIVATTIRENPGFSDQKIADILNGHGIDIARRTVTKHRLAASLKASSNRGRRKPKG